MSSGRASGPEADRFVRWALQERVKELTCLYGISRLAAETEAPLAETLQGIVELLPPAWQFPDVAAARLTLDDQVHTTDGFVESEIQQVSPIVIGGETRGSIEVVYGSGRDEIGERPFLAEERHLLDSVAREISLIVHRKEAEAERLRMADQLLHADRLATIGQLAAGVAHEINEPLGGILGFAQLALKCPGLPSPAEEDLKKVVGATLHAREIVRKLLLFARQMPPRKSLVRLDDVVREGLTFLEPRCATAGIEIVRDLAPGLPGIVADSSQIQQVLVNLVVNAIQAMPMGGRLMVKTSAVPPDVCLTVEDTGTGMSESVLRQIFTPFFTTKDVGHGTGLGLPVVHGIVTSHGGRIQVSSRLGAGSRFEVFLPVAAA